MNLNLANIPSFFIVLYSKQTIGLLKKSRLLPLTIFVIVFLSSIESLHFDFIPHFVNSRRFSILAALLFLFILMLFSRLGRKVVRDFLFTSDAIAVLIYFFSTILASIMHPPLFGPHAIFYSVVPFPLFLFSLVAINTFPNQSRVLTTKVILSIIVVSVTLSLFSLIVWLYPDFRIITMKNLFAENIWSYNIMDYSRGRLYPVGILSATAPAIIYLFSRKTRSRIMKIVNIFSLQVVSLGVMATNYRSHILTGFLGTILILRLLNWKKNELFRLYKKIFIASSIAFVFTLVFLPTNFVGRVMLKDRSDLETLKVRLKYMSDAVKIFQLSPLLGVGPGNYPAYSPEIGFFPRPKSISPNSTELKFPLFQPGDPHNSFLLILSETGVIGFLAYMFLLSSFAKNDLNFAKKNPRRTETKLLMGLSWIFLLMTTLDSSPPHGWLYFFLLRGAVFKERSFYETHS